MMRAGKFRAAGALAVLGDVLGPVALWIVPVGYGILVIAEFLGASNGVSVGAFFERVASNFIGFGCMGEVTVWMCSVGVCCGF
jgi:hypothetical protein